MASINILLVDDDIKNLTVLEAILDAPDYHLIKASSAEETLRVLMDHDCAAIVMDVKMPDMSGIELAQLIKQRKKTQHIPILFLTAHYYEERHVVLGYDAGAVDYITKPVHPAVLRSKIAVFVDLFRKTSELARLNIAMEAEIMDRQKAQAELLATNEELAVKNAELERAAHDRVRRIRAEAARAEAEAANSAKDRFLAMLSHELRTPLSPVLHAVALIEEEAICPPPLRDLLETIRRNVQLEARLIDDLLDIARIRNGKLQLNLESVDAHDLLRRAVQICEPDILKRSLELRFNLTATHCRMQADSARIQQIFWNLINNALKFTPPGGAIELSTFDDESTGRLRVEVEDSGIGIQAARLSKIFDAFEQAHGDRSTGLGLGLAISRVLTEMHGGTIEARSPGTDKGCIFTVLLPVTADASEEPASSPPQLKSLPVQLRILLVEDHADTAVNLKRLLEKRRCHVQTAATFKEAKTLIKESAFDVLVTDIGLPDGHGADLMKPFLASAKSRPVAGIALSGYAMPEDIRRTRDAGFAHHLTKPIDISQLQTVLASIGNSLHADRQQDR